MRLHTDETLKILDRVTILLGEQIRNFKNTTCAEYKTRELDREVAARKRRELAQQQTKDRSNPPSVPLPEGITFTNDSRRITPSASSPAVLSSTSNTQQTSLSASSPENVDGATDSRRIKTLNLETFKYHALGDISATIRRYGTTDSYSTQLVSVKRCQEAPSISFCLHHYLQGELEHRTSKNRYRRTNRKGFLKQLTQIERRQYRIRAIREKYKNSSARLETEVVDRNPEAHHQIGKSQNFPEHIGMFLQKHDKDPATKVSISFE